MTYTLGMDFGELIVMGGVLLSIIGSAVTNKLKKAALAKKAGGSPGVTGSTAPQQPTLRTTGPRTKVLPPKPVKFPRVDRPPAQAPLEAPPSDFPATPESRPAVPKWSWRRAIIAQTVLGPPRGLKDWGQE
jgi:hypothetical protein